LEPKCSLTIDDFEDKFIRQKSVSSQQKCLRKEENFCFENTQTFCRTEEIEEGIKPAGEKKSDLCQQKHLENK
jgi:hypothetical protein